MKPTFTVEANGADITKLIASRLIEIRVTDEVGDRSDALEIVLDDRDGVVEIPDNDVTLTVKLGFDDQLIPMGEFSGLETELYGPPDTIVIRGSAFNLRKSLKVKKTRSFDNVTLSDIVSTIAGEHDYSAIVDESLLSITYTHLDQTSETDWQFLVRLARDADAFVKAAAGNIVVAKNGGARSVATAKALPKVVIKRTQVSRYRLKHTDKTRINSVKAKWYDKSAGEMKEYVAGSGDPLTELATQYPNEDEATRAAEARLALLQRKEKDFEITLAPGNPKALAAGDVELQGFRKGVDGSYRATKVEHVLRKRGGLETTISGEL